LSPWCCFLHLFCSSFQVLMFKMFTLLFYCSLFVDGVVLMKLVSDSCKWFWSRIDLKRIRSSAGSEYSRGRRMNMSSNIAVIEKRMFLNICGYSAWGSGFFFFVENWGHIPVRGIVPACFSFFVGNIQRVFSCQVDMRVHTPMCIIYILLLIF